MQGSAHWVLTRCEPGCCIDIRGILSIEQCPDCLVQHQTPAERLADVVQH